jgi:CDP-glycerol glycerophosphotransferase (TagB/SpsB family)
MDRYPDIIDILSQNKNITVLWRPHPLMEATLASMRPHLLEKYRELKNTVKTKQNVIIDDSADLDRAIIVSDAMVTDISSLIYKFLLTQKPLMLLTSSYNVQNVKETVKFFDYSSSYFWYMDEFIFDRANVTDIEYKKHREKCGVLTGTERRDIGLQEFVGVVLSGNDYLKEARIASIKKYAPDAGNCGSKINNIINNAVLGR